jgi:hypothetical protein
LAVAEPPSGVTDTADDSGTTVTVVLAVSPYGDVAYSVIVPFPLWNGPVVKLNAALVELPGATVADGDGTEQPEMLPVHVALSVYDTAELPVLLIENCGSLVE